MSGFFFQAYCDQLKDLNSIELKQIKLLRDLAQENLPEAPNVVAALEQHISQCTSAQRLPALYVVDILAKTVAQPFVELFGPVIPRVFSGVWEQADPSLRSKLTKLVGTWKDTFPEAVLSAVRAEMVAPTQAALPVQHALPAPIPPFAPLQPAAGLLPGALLPGFVHGPYVAAAGQTLLPQPVNYLAPAPVAPAPAWGYTQPGQPLLGATILPASHFAPSQPATDLVTSLLNLSKHLGGQGVPGAAGSGGGAAPRPQRKDLTQQALKDHDAVAVEALMRASDATRKALFQHRFLRKRRLENTIAPVRHWYTTVDQWLQGTRPDTDVQVSFFEEEGATAAAAEAAAAKKTLEPVEEDPSQPTCAISGEAFERTYDPDTDKWYYEDAVVLRGEEAAAHDVMDGSIVKVHCLAGAPPALTAAAKIVGQGAGQQGAATVDVVAELMTAAAQAPAESNAAQPPGSGAKKHSSPLHTGGGLEGEQALKRPRVGA